MEDHTIVNTPRDSGDRSPSITPTLCLWALIVFASSIWLQQGHLRQDVDAYREIGQNLCETHTLARTLPSGERCPTAYRPPLYPSVLAALAGFRRITPFHVAILHLGIGLAITLLTYQVAAGFSERVARLAAFLVPLDPLLLRWSSFPMTEALATLMVLLILRMGMYWHHAYTQSAGVYRGAVRSHRPSSRSIVHIAGMWGAVFGLATLCRPVFLAWAVLSSIGLSLLRPRNRLAPAALAVLLGALAVLLPWTLRNRRMVGVATPLTTHGGYTLLLSNNPLYYEHLRTRGWREPWDAKQLQGWLAEVGVAVPHQCQQFEGDYDRSCRRLAVQSIREEPGMFVYASLIRLAQLWSPLPHKTRHAEAMSTRFARYSVAAWYLAVFGTAVLGLRRAHRQLPFLVQLGLLACIAFSCVHTVYFSNMRMRTPLMPWWTMMAAVQLDDWLGRLLRTGHRDRWES